jgi:TrmH family RNA methyltransferase
VPTLRVVLVEPKNEGNVGAVARAMRNFGAQDLVLVNPGPLGAEARKRAMHGLSILESARKVDTFDQAIEDADFVVGTSDVETTSEKRFARIATNPRDFAKRVAPMAGVLALVFGREDFGLFDPEIRRCDVLVAIPASPDYPSLNLSHAATILLYELYTAKAPQTRRKASGLEKEKLYEALAAVLDATDYPAHKRERTKVMFRRLLGRAVPSKWEFHALMGVFQRAWKRIERLERKGQVPRQRSDRP